MPPLDQSYYNGSDSSSNISMTQNHQPTISLLSSSSSSSSSYTVKTSSFEPLYQVDNINENDATLTNNKNYGNQQPQHPASKSTPKKNSLGETDRQKSSSSSSSTSTASTVSFTSPLSSASSALSSAALSPPRNRFTAGNLFFGTSRRLAAAATGKLQEYKEQRNIVSNLDTAFYTLFDFLEKKGVANACIQELKKQMKASHTSSNTTTTTTSSVATSSHSSNSSHNVYVEILEQCQQYAECIFESLIVSAATTPAVSASRSSSPTGYNVSQTIDIESMNQMIIVCWTQLCMYVSYQYKHAYKTYHGLRDKINERKQQEMELIQRQLGIVTTTSSPNSTILHTEDGLDLPVLSCSDDFVGSEFNTVQHGTSQQQSSSSSPSRKMYFGNPLAQQQQLERALKQQIQLAEECCSCQKGLLLAQSTERKQRQHVQRIKKQRMQQQQQQQPQ